MHSTAAAVRCIGNIGLSFLMRAPFGVVTDLIDSAPGYRYDQVAKEVGHGFLALGPLRSQGHVSKQGR